MLNFSVLTKINIIVLGVFATFGALQCAVQQPAVKDKKFASPVTDHTRFTANCSTCHEDSRLPATQDLVKVPHGFGRDCLECHEYNAQAPSWKPLAYDHDPFPTACLGCHNLPGEMAKYQKPNAHNNGQLRGDCVGCHKTQTLWDVKRNP